MNYLLEIKKNKSNFLTERENLNAKIEVCLELFEQLNIEMSGTNNQLTVYYDEVKNNMVKVLNEIVENYVYRNSKKISYEGKIYIKNNQRIGAKL